MTYVYYHVILYIELRNSHKKENKKTFKKGLTLTLKHDNIELTKEKEMF
ncbi:hypothetical protein HOR18_gp009 [Staphylococcus phage vB_SscM-1]|uniref:Uncharacterized protein n=2 Tax=Sciuriunavirus SscM1 TaxID=2734053 RepID=A0A1X9I9E6_9CAUD|nr:hypothetical protein HOR18_gp009 [Staphylococcus phage vB_SscM-1]ANT44672.1 hypothetical protein vB_SscM-1_009 [Staphylococcus phage vB_SscM-1]ANT44875.1 hypothetical protein vB_SscM-2_008a [Staphylococcus phage vB_SscM-2]